MTKPKRTDGLKVKDLRLSGITPRAYDWLLNAANRGRLKAQVEHWAKETLPPVYFVVEMITKKGERKVAKYKASSGYELRATLKARGHTPIRVRPVKKS